MNLVRFERCNKLDLHAGVCWPENSLDGMQLRCCHCTVQSCVPFHVISIVAVTVTRFWWLERVACHELAHQSAGCWCGEID